MPDFKSTSVSRKAVGEDVEGVQQLQEKKMSFVSLHHHSTYSFLDGYGHPVEHMSRAAELGMTAMALTEHGHVSSHPKLEMAAERTGVKPLYGCELYCGPDEPVQRKNHLTVLAEDEVGYRNLLKVVSWAWQEGFYYEPTVTGKVLADHRAGLVVLSGCTGSLLSTSLIGGKNIDVADASYDSGLEIARRFHRAFGDGYYIEVQAFPELESTCTLNPQLARIARQLKIPLVATADVHYPFPDQNEMQNILHAVRPGRLRTVEEQAREWSYDVLLTHPTSDLRVRRALEGTGLSRREAQQAIASTEEIAERCTVSLPKAMALSYPLPENVSSSKELLIRWLKKGWTYRSISRLKRRDEYAKRLEYEVEMIESKDFVDYFLFVSEMVRWAKDHGIFVGPARGSAAGSLLCYLLRITEVDPMIFPDLIFERFIDVTRKDLPDIDLDFDDRRRFEVFDWLGERFGKENVAKLGTFTTYKSKNSLDDVARVYDIPRDRVDLVKSMIIERSSGDLRASSTIEDTIEMFSEVKEVFEEYPNLYKATRLEGMVKGMGTHAAGAIVSSQPVTDTCAIYRNNTTAVDKYDAEYLGLLKVDNLGLATCGMIAEALGLLGLPLEAVYDIPLDDAKTLEGFKENDVSGIFQFDGRAMRLVNSFLIPDNFYEVCVVNALARPGPLHNNAMTDYVDIKKGIRQPEDSHPLFDQIVSHTHQQVVYQEQVLRIVSEIGDFDWTHAAYIRKIISRKIGDQEFNRQWARFLEGAKGHGLTEEEAKKIWGLCITSGSYAFNAAHSVSYGMLGWWTMWLKRHHPQVFYVSALRRLGDGGTGKPKHMELMRDAYRHGIDVLKPDPEKSGIDWEPEGSAIRAGLSQIPGIGDKMAAVIVAFRKERGASLPMAWGDLLAVRGIGPKTVEKILAWGDQSDPFGVHILDKKMRRVVKAIRSGRLTGTNGRRLPIPTHTSEKVPFERGPDLDVVWIGVITGRNLRDLFEINMRKTGVALDPREVKDPELRESVLMYGLDAEGQLTLKVDRWRYPQFREVVWSIEQGRDLVLVRGVKFGNIPYKLINVREMTVIE